MAVRQISVFLENKAGTLVEVTSILAENSINIRAISVADTTRFGILRLIVDKPELAEGKLKEEGFTVSVTHVIAAGISDEPGGLSQIAKLFTENGISIDYVYAFISHSSNEACIMLRVDEIDKAEAILKENGVTVFSEEEVFSI